MLSIKTQLMIHRVCGVAAAFAPVVGALVFHDTQYGLEGVRSVVLEPKRALPALIANQPTSQKARFIHKYGSHRLSPSSVSPLRNRLLNQFQGIVSRVARENLDGLKQVEGGGANGRRQCVPDLVGNMAKAFLVEPGD